MAATVLKGNITTSDPVADEQVVDMRNEFYELDPDDSQFTTLLVKLGTRAAVREKISWLEDQLRPRLLTLSASAASTDTSVNVTAGQGTYIAVDDTIRNLTTGELMHVSGVTTDAIGVDRGIGGVTAASSASTAQLFLVGSAYKQGASYGTSRIVKRVLGFEMSPLAVAC
jgi:hypothetical protein